MNIYTIAFMALPLVGIAIFYLVVFPRIRASTFVVQGKNARALLPPQTVGAFDALAQGQLDGARAVLQELRRQSQFSELSCLLEYFGENLERSSLDAAIAASPQDAQLYLLRGQQAIKWAWQARGHGAGSGVSEDDALRFAERMHLAEGDFLQAATLDPKDPTPFARLVAIAPHYREDAESFARSALEQALHRNEKDYAARMAYFGYFCRTRWGGSPASMRNFAQASVQGARLGDLRLSFLAEVHFDNWTHELFFGTPEAANNHLMNEQAQGEVATSFANSVASQYHQAGCASSAALNSFAMWFFALGDHERCAQAFQRLRADECVPATWAAIVDGTTTYAGQQFLIARNWALEGGKHRILA